MKPMHKAFAAIAIAAAVGAGGAIVSGNAWADPDPGHGGRSACSDRESAWKGHGHRGFAMAKALGLSAEQKERIGAIFRSHRDEIAPLRTKMASERRDLRKMMYAEKTDDAAIREQVRKIAATGGDLAVLRAGISREVRTVLTPGQVEKFRALQEKRDHRFDRMMHRWDERRSNGD